LDPDCGAPGRQKTGNDSRHGENHAGRDQSCGIVGLEAVKETGKEARREDRDRQSKRKASHKENRHFAQDHAEYASLLRAKRHANADFIAPPGDVVRHDAVEPDDGQSQRKGAEESGERCKEGSRPSDSSS
jgi:hypothetical protein